MRSPTWLPCDGADGPGGRSSLEEVREELAGRHVIDHKVKQEKMASDQA